MPSQTAQTFVSNATNIPLALPVPRKKLSLLTSPTLGDDVSLYINHKRVKSDYGYTYHERIQEDAYAPPAPPPPSPINFPLESWSPACRR
ncbi:hypothetical protein BP5796_02425 [Coleophoma crateriformis]|uniref:Uncharacterized protein n=1 Tax=Coleophoma crateriformis TaxID=565419 RepID=A0A3D8SYC2_9HELO|nr:hypothetical protein BP5796_02425 [Coleophoma crateriformis]